MKTVSTNPKEALRQRRWWVVDMEGQVLGRAASRIARVLQGKHRGTYTPHVDDGDFVIVVNADKFVLTGRKREQKRYYRHSGYPGGLRQDTVDHLEAKRPGEVVRRAVAGMLPKNKLGRRMIRKLKVYVGPDHPHAAQQPEPLNVSEV